MDRMKYLIILNGVDKTEQVESYDRQDSKIFVKFEWGVTKPYSYHLKNVIIDENPTVMDVTDKEVYIQNLPVFDVQQILVFNQIAKVLFNNKTTQICDVEYMSIEDKGVSKNSIRNILKYWKEIAQHTNTNDEVESDSFLKKQFDKLTSIHPESVLGCYLNKDPLKKLNPTTNDIIFPFKYNLSQKQAVENALGNNISVIEGPPGTGKTQTILNIVANLAAMQNKTIAIVSGNNAAVQNVKDKLEKGKYNFFVASLGNIDNQKEFFKHLPQADIAGWKSEVEESVLIERINKLNGQINHLMALNNHKAILQQELSAYRLEQQHYDHYYENQNVQEMERSSLFWRFYRETPDKIISFLAENHLAIKQDKSNSILHKVKLLIKFGYTDFKNLKEHRIDVMLKLQKDYYVLKIKFLENNIEDIQKELEQGLFDDLLKQHEQDSTSLFKHKLHAKYDSRNPMDLTINTYKKSFETFIDYYPVVLSTTHSLRNCISNNFMFDYVIIDESSQVDLLTGALALSCCKNAIIVGDTKQLPHIVTQDVIERFKKDDIENIYNYIEHNILSSMLALYSDDLPKVILKEHYRCHPKIIEYCNQKYYNGELISFTEEKENDVPLMMYRTAKGNHTREVTKGVSKGKFNQREIDIIQEVILNPMVSVTNDSDIGFTTPYRKQVEKATMVLSKDTEIDTIHKYQGREKPLMILSTVLDNSASGKMGMRFVNDPCKINVAVSRAQKQFILVTGEKVFRKIGNEIGDLIRYIEYSTLDDNVIQSELVSVFDLLYTDFSDKLISFQSRLFQKLKYRSENIAYTLIDDILSEDKYSSLEFTTQVSIKNLLNNVDKLNEEERKYVKHNASVDFVFYHKFAKEPLLAIEVDGFQFHENNPVQQVRDDKKNNILEKYDLPLLRLVTQGSGEEQKIRDKLDAVMKSK
ncbi:AAA domain-containing protein [Paenibacillus glacialis]|uniref:DNA helicase n=1 Tax=Paenibacillus glacialis TaxID=494026 RepID=A0A168F9Y0_9BACL|nr:AAA domain-containing protein [Paenibacillus glacialis]OAB35997.1 hypothetical protein PGLA_21465 [Paenibacillus glacialis]